MYDPQDKKTSLQYIIYNSPYGSLQRMIQDLSLVYDFKESSEEVQEAIMNHQQDNYEIFFTDEGRIITSKANYVAEGEGYYFDGVEGKKYVVDHYTGNIENIEESEDLKGDEAVQLFGNAIKKYLEEFFGDNSHVVVFEKDGNYHIIYTCKVKNSGSFYNGYWASHWTYNAESSKLTGDILLKAHMFENGNVFFTDTKQAEEDIEQKPDSAKEFVEEVVTKLMTVERKLVKRLSQHYEKDSQELFKSIRVALPFTMERINWDVKIQNVVQTLRNNEQAE